MIWSKNTPIHTKEDTLIYAPPNYRTRKQDAEATTDTTTTVSTTTTVVVTKDSDPLFPICTKPNNPCDLPGIRKNWLKIVPQLKKQASDLKKPPKF